MSDEAGVEAVGRVPSGTGTTTVTVRCISGNSMTYVFELNDRMDDVGIMGGEGALRLRLDDEAEGSTRVRLDHRFPSRVTLSAADISAALDGLAYLRSQGHSADNAQFFVVRMALAERIRMSFRTARGQTFLDFRQPAVVREVQRQCGVTATAMNDRISSARSADREDREIATEMEGFRDILQTCMRRGFDPDGIGLTPEIGFDIAESGPEGLNADFADEASTLQRLRQCWPDRVSPTLIGRRLTMRIPV